MPKARKQTNKQNNKTGGSRVFARLKLLLLIFFLLVIGSSSLPAKKSQYVYTLYRQLRTLNKNPLA